MVDDPYGHPVYKWRVPYVVVNGLPRAPLKELVVDPYVLMKRGSGLVLNAQYYILKCINPALTRVLGLCGAPIDRCVYRTYCICTDV